MQASRGSWHDTPVSGQGALTVVGGDADFGTYCVPAIHGTTGLAASCRHSWVRRQQMPDLAVDRLLKKIWPATD